MVYCSEAHDHFLLRKLRTASCHPCDSNVGKSLKLAHEKSEVYMLFTQEILSECHNVQTPRKRSR